MKRRVQEAVGMKARAAAPGRIVAICGAALALVVGAAGDAGAQSVRMRHIHFYRRGVYSIDAEYPVFAGHSPVEQTEGRAAERWVRGQCALLVSNAVDDYRHREDIAPAYYYERDDGITCTVTLDRSDLASCYFEENADLGGEHPVDGVTAITVGVKGGGPAQLELADLFGPAIQAPLTLDAIVLPRLKAEGDNFVADGSVKSLTDQYLTWAWAVSPRGIVLLFPPGSVIPEADPLRVMTVTYAELHGSLDRNGPLTTLLAGSG
jgi:hypothetical protein